ncbi:MAG: 1-(5-phosphoribosyl)-5-[(5-phosphoribosylamino)methylideneamino]imidazole-4-carboxamide isomerase [Candidatus Limnocylindrales bacterium]
MPFELFPAIDLRGGAVVRLVQGDFDRATVYPGDPATIGRAFVAEGARWIHVVDLDGARAGEPRQIAAIRSVIDAVAGRARTQVAGGLRTEAAVGSALDAGAGRVVVGTAALRDPSFVMRIVEAHGPDAIAVALDVRDGVAIGEAWRSGADGADVDDALRRLADAGVETFVITAIERDGLLEGPDLELLARLVLLDRGAIVASGGIASLDDLRAVRAIGCRGAIVGRAVYEGRIRLDEAITAIEAF